ncbi:trypco2 family protein [Nocardioides pinisoli]|uniref:trypco2 family protein n=1 Tax=Nocardioides pinisoli TaxID=2950279 RepID=UPI00355690E1
MGTDVGLAEAIAVLREELVTAMEGGSGARVQFAVGPVDLEFQTEVGREGGVGGKVRFWVVEAGAEGKVSSASTQLVKIHLQPIDSTTKKPVLVAEGIPSSPNSPPGGARPSPAVD